MRGSWWRNVKSPTCFRQVHQSRFSPDLRISLSGWPLTLLASCSLLRRRFWDSLRGLMETSAALPTTGAEWMKSPQSKIPVPAVSTTQTDHLILASGCRVTAGCSTSVLTSRVGNARPSPWLGETSVTGTVKRSTFVTEGTAPLLCLLPGEHGQQPVLLLVSKHLADILLKTQREAVLVGASSKDWRPEGLCRRTNKQWAFQV